jgi:hypothetical protein
MTPHRASDQPRIANPKDTKRRLLAEVALLARLDTNLTEHHAREQPHVPREHVQPNLVIRSRALREVRQVVGDAVAENLEQRRVVFERRARGRGRDHPAEQRREVHRNGGLLPVVVKLQVGGRENLGRGARLDALAALNLARERGLARDGDGAEGDRNHFLHERVCAEL